MDVLVQAGLGAVCSASALTVRWRDIDINFCWHCFVSCEMVESIKLQALHLKLVTELLQASLVALRYQFALFLQTFCVLTSRQQPLN